MREAQQTMWHRKAAGPGRSPHSPAATAILSLPGDESTAGHVTGGSDHLAPLWGGAGGGRGRSDRTTSPRGAGGERAAPLQPSAAPRPRCGHRYRDNGAGAGGARRNGAGRGFFVLLRRSPPARRRLPGAVRRGGAGTARGRAERRRGGGGGQPGSPARRAVGTGRMGRGEVPRPCLSVAAQGRSAGRGSTLRAHEAELPARCREQHALSPLFVSPLLAAPISPPSPPRPSVRPSRTALPCPGASVLCRYRGSPYPQRCVAVRGARLSRWMHSVTELMKGL